MDLAVTISFVVDSDDIKNPSQITMDLQKVKSIVICVTAFECHYFAMTFGKLRGKANIKKTRINNLNWREKS